MNIKSRFGLWWRMIISVFLIMNISVVLIAIAIFIIYKLSHYSNDMLKHIFPFIAICILSIIVSTFFTIFIMHRILKPIEALIIATKQVAKGDFSVRLNENYKESTIKDMNSYFNKMIRELDGIETFRNDFIVNVSHEFKTPISAIEGYATLLQDRGLCEEEHDEYTKMIIESARQLSILSSNILKLSKLESQEIVVEKTIYQLDEQIRQALLLLEVKWSKKNINLNIDLSPIEFYGNEDLLIQVWFNLLSNAIKFTPENGSIQIVMRQIDQLVTVEISDTGIGMTEDTRKHIFEKFYQGDKNRNVEGNGLGLTLVKRIIDLCNGEIKVQSEYGKGSTFIVKLENTEV
ncbi:HAMP domain-containing sensor histidine kinase [Inconstantimicrobium mannanitabidum]|uniref:Two component sensor kinase n=1 Tax=Inconstantimicrobium mannanitabidum TaxID=1604901 RepID=A0ACB5R7U9_9CLOT|nr:HAMP domain-containing sensor histidine kinase [Clostridium sp. TW13]GKX65247.1 two component sensor kinase [Clostridium sp. TW13]